MGCKIRNWLPLLLQILRLVGICLMTFMWSKIIGSDEVPASAEFYLRMVAPEADLFTARVKSGEWVKIDYVWSRNRSRIFTSYFASAFTTLCWNSRSCSCLALGGKFFTICHVFQWIFLVELQIWIVLV